MVVGVSGRHGSHAAWRVEEETEHVLARALIQLQNGTEWIVLGQISPQRAAIWANVKVENTQKRVGRCLRLNFFFLNVYMTDIFLICLMDSTWQYNVEMEKEIDIVFS